MKSWHKRFLLYLPPALVSFSSQMHMLMNSTLQRVSDWVEVLAHFWPIFVFLFLIVIIRISPGYGLIRSLLYGSVISLLMIPAPVGNGGLLPAFPAFIFINVILDGAGPSLFSARWIIYSLFIGVSALAAIYFQFIEKGNSGWCSRTQGKGGDE